MVVYKAVAGTWLRNIVPFEIKFTCVHGHEQRVAFSMFECIRTRFTLVLTTFRVAFVSTTVSLLKAMWVMMMMMIKIVVVVVVVLVVVVVVVVAVAVG